MCGLGARPWGFLRLLIRPRILDPCTSSVTPRPTTRTYPLPNIPSNRSKPIMMLSSGGTNENRIQCRYGETPFRYFPGFTSKNSPGTVSTFSSSALLKKVIASGKHWQREVRLGDVQKTMGYGIEWGQVTRNRPVPPRSQGSERLSVVTSP